MITGYIVSPKTNPPEEKKVVRPVVPLNDRKANMAAQLLGFMAEHDIPFTQCPDIISLAQTMAKDIKALNSLSMDRTTASYKMNYGLAQFFNGKLDKELQKTFFSLNIDESTTSSLEKVVAVLVSYFSEEEGQIVVKHLESFKIVNADAANLFFHTCQMFEKHGLAWENLISVLLDSCSTMRGKKSGLETRMREKADHLLDIDGDAVHHAHNAAKAFSAPFQYFLEGLFNDIHADFQYCDDLRGYLEGICEILNIKYTMPERFLSHRFLSAYQLALDTQRLLDTYTIFYFSFIKDKKEAETYRPIYQEVLRRKNVSAESLEQLQNFKVELSKRRMTKDGKERINDKLFYERRKTKMLLSIYAATLQILKEYTLLFQGKDPMIHIIHDEQTRLLREFLGYFIKPEKLPKGSKKLVALNLELKDNWLPESEMFMGRTARKVVQKSNIKDYIVKDVLDRLSQAYVNCATKLQQRMPVNNQLLKTLSAIDPSARGHSLTLRYLLNLPTLMTNVFAEDEETAYEKEVHLYNSDPTLPEFGTNKRVDHWWAAITDYPLLRKIVLAALTCFHGPLVEGCFNLMGDVLDAKSCRLGIDSLNAIQTIKSHLSKEGSLAYFDRSDHLFDPIVPGLTHCMMNASREQERHRAEKRHEKEMRKERLQIAKQTVVSKRAAAEHASKAVKRAKLAHFNRTKLSSK